MVAKAAQIVGAYQHPSRQTKMRGAHTGLYLLGVPFCQLSSVRRRCPSHQVLQVAVQAAVVQQLGQDEVPSLHGQKVVVHSSPWATDWE